MAQSSNHLNAETEIPSSADRPKNFGRSEIGGGLFSRRCPNVGPPVNNLSRTCCGVVSTIQTEQTGANHNTM